MVATNDHLPTEAETKWRSHWVSAGIFVVVLALGALTTATAFYSRRGESSTRAALELIRTVREGNAAAACRSQLAAPVTDKRTDLDDAEAQAVRLTSLSSDILGDGLLAFVADDQDGLDDAVVRRHIVQVAQARVDEEIERARGDLRAANTYYQASLKLQSTDPVAFLRRCNP